MYTLIAQNKFGQQLELTHNDVVGNTGYISGEHHCYGNELEECLSAGEIILSKYERCHGCNNKMSEGSQTCNEYGVEQISGE